MNYINIANMKIKQFILNIICLLLAIYIDGTYNLKGILIICIFILNIYYIKRIYTQKFYLTEINKAKKITLIICGIFLCFFFSIFYNVLTYLIFKDLTPYIPKEVSLFEIIKAMLLFPILEEIVFRKYLLTSLLITYTEKKAVLLSSLGFTVCHVFTDTGLLQAFIGGYFFSWIYLRGNNIVICIVLHSFLNFLYIYLNPILKIHVTENYLIGLVLSLLFIVLIITILKKQFNKTKQ